MAICKCKMCGGDLNITGTDKLAVCDYCGTRQTVPGADSEKKMSLFNRANRLRMNNEFDKAAALYEQIAAEFTEEAEAYWGLCLCNYGIEYVDDPATGAKKPTCHRASFEKLTNDENYSLAMEYADISAQRQYREEAREIDRINEEILSISRNERPYDVFICYKETDDTGARTPDSVLAQDIYDALTDRGFKVFFSRITLEDKLGMQYEPYIFAALNSAKIMLSVGTKYEYFHAVWVKNEWGRFLRLAAKDKRKVLIPCYKDMDPYDMPDEFKGLQAQDMNKLGALQDLVRGVAKLLGAAAPSPQPAPAASSAGATANSLLKRGYMFLADNEWASADEYAEKVLDMEPENADAYFCKLLAKTQTPSPAAFPACRADVREDKLLQKTKTFGSAKTVQLLDDYIRNYTAYEEEQRQKGLPEKYKAALQTMQQAGSSDAFADAAKALRALGDYADAPALAQQCEHMCELYLNACELRLVIEVKKTTPPVSLFVDGREYPIGSVDYIQSRAISVLPGTRVFTVADAHGKRSEPLTLHLGPKEHLRLYAKEKMSSYTLFT